MRLAKRNVDSFDRFKLLLVEQLKILGLWQQDKQTIEVYEVLDLMRNHVDDQVAESALLYLLQIYSMSFKSYIFVSSLLITG